MTHRTTPAVLFGILLILAACSPPPSPADTTPPDVPVGFVASAGDGEVTLRWQPNGEEDLAGYNLAWGTGEGTLSWSRFVPALETEATVTGLDNGLAYTFGIDAEDERGNRSERRSTHATPVSADATAPQVVSTAPATGSAEVATTTALTLFFSEAMDVGSVAVEITPATRIASSSWSDVDTTLTLTVDGPLAFATAYGVRVRGRDTAGNELEPFAFTFTTAALPDTTPPRVESSAPADGASDVPGASDIVLSFSEPMERTSVEGAFRTDPAIACAFHWSADDRSVSCEPLSDLAESHPYAVELGSDARDRAGNPLESAFRFGFTTAALPDTTAPEVLSSSPVIGEIGVARDAAVTIVFSEPMDPIPTQDAFAIIAPAGFETGSFDWNAAGTELTFTPSTDFAHGAEVRWRVSATARDLAGNPLAGEASGGFRVLRRSTRTLTSTADLDGTVFSTGSVATAPGFLPDGLVGDASDDASHFRGFLSFDLSELPADLVRITEATLHVYQANVIGHPYLAQGNLLAESVAYGPSLDSRDLDTAVLRTFQCWFTVLGPECGLRPERVTLSTDGAIGFRSAPATRKVANDWAGRDGRGHRSQYRLRFSRDISANAAADYAIFGTGDTEAWMRPRLEIAFEHP